MNTQAAYLARLDDPGDLGSAYAFCADLARSHYENFPVASRLLSRRARKPIAALYAFARIADDFADEPEYEGVRRERLMEWQEHLAHAAAGRPSSHPVFAALGDSLRNQELPAQPFEDLLSAFLQDTERKRYSTFEELLDYCRRSANPVGRLVLMVHGYRSEALFNYSDAICTALQLANFWQDISVDLAKDRIYIPAEDFQTYGYTEADLRMGVVNEKFRDLMKYQYRRTRALFDQGWPLTQNLSFPLSWEIRLTWLGGSEILRKIRKSGYDTLTQRPALSKWDWIPLLARSLTG